jgi:mono/diheme cytochrome c family protein
LETTLPEGRSESYTKTEGRKLRYITRKLLFISGAAIVAGFLLIQAVPYGRAHTNPPVISEPQWNSQRTRELAVKACFDCHSNETQWPWYSNVAPISWYVQNHVEEGRDELNFSEWNRSQKEARESAEKVLEGEMPPLYYHPWDRLTSAEVDELARGLQATLGGRLSDD